MIEFLIMLVVLGLVFYLVDRFIPMSAPFKMVFRIVSVVILIFMVLSLFNFVNLPFRLR